VKYKLYTSLHACTCNVIVKYANEFGCVKPINDIHKNRGDNPIQDSPVKESAIRLFNENTTPNTDSTETELTLLKFRLDQNQSFPHTRSRAQSRRTLVVSRHCFSSSDRRWPHTTTLFDANRSQSWAALSGLTKEKEAIFVLVSYRPSHIIFLRDWSIVNTNYVFN
jgi:hypothetical protein